MRWVGRPTRVLKSAQSSRNVRFECRRLRSRSSIGWVVLWRLRHATWESLHSSQVSTKYALKDGHSSFPQTLRPWIFFVVMPSRDSLDIDTPQSQTTLPRSKSVSTQVSQMKHHTCPAVQVGRAYNCSGAGWIARCSNQSKRIVIVSQSDQDEGARFYHENQGFGTR